MAEPSSSDRLVVAVVRLPRGECPYWRSALRDDAETMLAVGGVLFAEYPIEDARGTDVETALRALGVWGGGAFLD